MLRRRHIRFLALAALFAGPSFGCFTITTVNISQKTSLEHQLLGELEPLDDEELLAASVRAPEGLTAGAPGELKARAIAARQRQAFNRDDVRELKGLACLGETQRAALAARPCDAVASAETRALRDRVLAEENEDRTTILDWIASRDGAASADARTELVRLYRELLVADAKPGDWLEVSPGRWQQQP